MDLDELKFIIGFYKLPTEVSSDTNLEDLRYVIESDIQLNMGAALMELALKLKPKEENTLIKKFLYLIEKEFSLSYISKQFSQKELIAIGNFLGKDWNLRGSKIEKVKIIYEHIS